jgi:hypothetical protein
MRAVRQLSVLSLAAAATLLSSGLTAQAGGPLALTDRQMDRVTAGGATVGSSADAYGLGVFATATTTGNTFVTQGASPVPGNPGLGTSMGVAVGSAVGVGTNLGVSGAAPPSSGTSVTTSGTADGNFVINSTSNYVLQGAGGVTYQLGYTVVYGGWIGL